MIGQQSDRLPEFGCIHENINVDISPHRTFHNPKLVIVDKPDIFKNGIKESFLPAVSRDFGISCQTGSGF